MNRKTLFSILLLFFLCVAMLALCGCNYSSTRSEHPENITEHKEDSLATSNNRLTVEEAEGVQFVSLIISEEDELQTTSTPSTAAAEASANDSGSEQETSNAPQKHHYTTQSRKDGTVWLVGEGFDLNRDKKYCLLLTVWDMSLKINYTVCFHNVQLVSGAAINLTNVGKATILVSAENHVCSYFGFVSMIG